MMGSNFKPLPLKLPMGVEFNRKKAKRKSYIPIYINKNGEVMPVEYNGSAHIHSYVKADGMIYINIGETTLQKGQLVNVRQI
jgi:molybdopterin biosynthesis enzyme